MAELVTLPSWCCSARLPDHGKQNFPRAPELWKWYALGGFFALGIPTWQQLGNEKWTWFLIRVTFLCVYSEWMNLFNDLFLIWDYLLLIFILSLLWQFTIALTIAVMPISQMGKTEAQLPPYPRQFKKPVAWMGLKCSILPPGSEYRPLQAHDHVSLKGLTPSIRGSQQSERSAPAFFCINL